MEIIFLRHGETDMNTAGRRMGQRCDEPLNEVGKEQARQAREALVIHPSVVFSSPLKRAWETAEIVNQRLCAPCIARPELKERDFGALSGQTWEEMAHANNGTNFFEKDSVLLAYDYRPWGGECVDDVRVRIEKFLEDMRRSRPNETVLAVSHAGVIRLVYKILGQPAQEKISNAAQHKFII